jgi:hypothetical protein
MKASEFFSLSTEKQEELLRSSDDLVIDFSHHAQKILNELLSKIINGDLCVEQAQSVISKEQPNKQTIIIKVVDNT